MRIIHLSYARVLEYTDPVKWLARLDFFTIMLEKMTLHATVQSVHLINYAGILKRNLVAYHFLKKSCWEILLPFQLHRYLRKLEPDIVIVHGLIFPWQVFCLRLQLGSLIKIVLVHHAEKPLRYHKRFLQKLADRTIDAYFFTSYALAQPWIKAGLIKNKSKIYEVMIGSSIFCPIDRAFSTSKTKVETSGTYLWVGSLDENKDPITLVSAFILFIKFNPRKKLYLIYQEDFLLAKIRLLITGVDQIVLIGKVEHEELLYWYNSVDYIISTSRYEGGGTAVCEGMSCGCIPILSNIPSFRMMTNQGACGKLFTVGNVGELCNALVTSLTWDLQEERKKVFRQFSEKLSNEAIVQTMMGVFTQLKPVK